jgi:hypothetical protein
MAKASAAAKTRRSRVKGPVMGNMKLNAQTRKLLGKHYASKYRVR